VRFTICDAPQREPDWFRARLGKLTGSCAGDMLAKGRGSEESTKRRDLRIRLALERITGQAQEDGYVNAHMQRGIEMEPLAFAAYEAHTGQMVSRSGFLSLNGVEAGCSLDGHVGDFEGIVELKVPKSATHYGYLLGGVPPSDYLPQITHNLWITGSAWCDFMSFDDRFPAHLRVFLVRVRREDVDLAGYEQKALAFLAEVDRQVEAIQTMADLSGQLTRSVAVA
jgi:hypothetical protein